MYIQTSELPRLELGFQGHQCNWGVHFCGLYENEAERDEIIFGFLGQGIRDNDLQLYCPPNAAKKISDAIFGILPRMQEPSFGPGRGQLYSARELYYPNGSFSPWTMDDNLNAFYRKARPEGAEHPGHGKMVWALEAIPAWNTSWLMNSRLNYFILESPGQHLPLQSDEIRRQDHSGRPAHPSLHDQQGGHHRKPVLSGPG
jgi:hypothetical protein